MVSRIYHGCSKERLYKVWKTIKQRCCNTNNKNYPNYGGRGIYLANEWLNDYEAFKNYVLNNLGDYDSSNLTLDRIDNDGGYCPGNLRLTTRKVQRINQRLENVTYLTCFGETKCLKEWATDPRVLVLGLSEEGLRMRKKRGWSDENTLTRHKGYRLSGKLTLTLFSLTLTAKEWADLLEVKSLGLTYDNIRSRKREGWSDKETLTIPIGQPRVLRA